jgi:3-oxoacyl-[acyl-carrier protein] reductase
MLLLSHHRVEPAFRTGSCIVSQGDGPIALVSVGSRGIGAAIVRRLAASGWDVSFGYDGDEPSAREVEQAAREFGTRVTAVRVDMTDPEGVVAWVRQAGEELGPVEAAVSCAGIVRDRPPTLIQPADWRAVTGLEGMFHLYRAAVLPMMRQRSGRIVAVSSVVGMYGHAGEDLVAKPGIAGFVKALASQVGRFGILVNAVTPGPVGHELTAVVPERTHASLTETIALRRFGSAAEVADLVAFLLSDQASDRTGTVFETRGSVLA